MEQKLFKVHQIYKTRIMNNKRYTRIKITYTFVKCFNCKHTSVNWNNNYSRQCTIMQFPLYNNLYWTQDKSHPKGKARDCFQYLLILKYFRILCTDRYDIHPPMNRKTIYRIRCQNILHKQLFLIISYNIRIFYDVRNASALRKREKNICILQKKKKPPPYGTYLYVPTRTT